MKSEKIKALYLHIPFCKSICSYCDFCKIFYQKQLACTYLEALEKEIEERYRGEEIETLYIGGGTPSALDKDVLTKLFSLIDRIHLSQNIEFTFEMNVQDINEEILNFLKEHQVNRISVGIETVNEKFLNLLDRKHTKEQVYRNIDLAKKYFDNINVDFMYAFPNQTLDDLKYDLEFFITLNVPHISIYSLILEPNTKLYIHKTLPLDDSLEESMYFYIIHFLKEKGYLHYEISNFAKENYSSKHNLVYWNNEHYYGFGLGASGYIDNIRYTNTRSIHHYLEGNYILDKEQISCKINMENEMILGLRKIEGVNKEKFFDKYGVEIEKVFKIDNLIKSGLLIDRDGYLSISEDKLYISNSILVYFIHDEVSCSNK